MTAVLTFEHLTSQYYIVERAQHLSSEELNCTSFCVHYLAFFMFLPIVLSNCINLGKLFTISYIPFFFFYKMGRITIIRLLT